MCQRTADRVNQGRCIVEYDTITFDDPKWTNTTSKIFTLSFKVTSPPDITYSGSDNAIEQAKSLPLAHQASLLHEVEIVVNWGDLKPKVSDPSTS